MANQTIKARLQMKADTSANWTTASNNGFVPLKNELIFYTDVKKFKLGNGTQTVEELDFYEPEAGEVDFSSLTDTLTGAPATSKTITAFDQVDGKVSATFGDISITASQVSDFATEAAKYGPAYTDTDTKTTVAAGSGISVSGSLTNNSSNTFTVSHADTSSASNLAASGRRYVTGLTFDEYGHVTGYTTGTETDQAISGYKTTQSAKSFTGSSTQTVSSITQNANGEISVSFTDVEGGGSSSEKVYVTAGYEDVNGLTTFNNLEILSGQHEWYYTQMSEGKTYIVEYNGQKYKDTVEYTGESIMWSAGGFTLSDSGTLSYSTDSGITFSIYEDDGSLIFDTEMSDTSTNAVQNKVIKAYIDSKVGSGSGNGGESNSIPSGSRNYITVNSGDMTVDNVYLDESSYHGVPIEPNKKYYVIYNDSYVGSFMRDSSGDASLEGYLSYQQMDSYLNISKGGYYSIFYVSGDTSTDTGLVPDSGGGSNSGSSSSSSGGNTIVRTIWANSSSSISLDSSKTYIIIASRGQTLYNAMGDPSGEVQSMVSYIFDGNLGELKNQVGSTGENFSIYQEGSTIYFSSSSETHNIIIQEVSDYQEITCFIEGSQVLLYDPETKTTYAKAIEDIKPGEQTARWDPDKGRLIGSRVLCPPIAGDCNDYDVLTFSNGSSVNVYGRQHFWNIDLDRLIEWHNLKPGDRMLADNGDIVEFVGSEHIESEKTLKHYTLCVFNGKYIVDGIHVGEKREILWSRVNKPENKRYMESILNDKDKANLEDAYIKGMKRRNFRQTPEYFEATKDIQETIRGYKKKIEQNKQYLASTDYMVAKLMEGLITEADFAEAKAKRQEARDEINSAEIILAAAHETLAEIETRVKEEIMSTITLKYAGKFVGKTRAVLD